MDRNWNYRGVPYRICLIALIIGFWPFLVGFGAPAWLWMKHKDENGTEVELSFGLWQICLEEDSCYNNQMTGNEVVDDWFLSVVIFETIALPIYILSLLVAVLQNFSDRHWLRTIRQPSIRSLLHRDSEAPEDLAFIAGFWSFLGIIIFMLMTSEEVSHGAVYSWGFSMAFIGAGISSMTGCLMCKTHIPVAAPREPPVVHTFESSQPQEQAAAAAAIPIAEPSTSRGSVSRRHR